MLSALSTKLTFGDDMLFCSVMWSTSAELAFITSENVRTKMPSFMFSVKPCSCGRTWSGL